MLKLKWNPQRRDPLGKMAKRLRPEVGKRLRVVGRMLRKEVKTNLSGRVLNKRTGALHKSWSHFEVFDHSRGKTLTYGSSSPYARIHELGGMAGRNRMTRIPARPYAWRAVIALSAKIRKEIGDAIRFVARKVN